MVAESGAGAPVEAAPHRYYGVVAARSSAQCSASRVSDASEGKGQTKRINYVRRTADCAGANVCSCKSKRLQTGSRVLPGAPKIAYHSPRITLQSIIC
jgi:hypothetical protein